MTLLGHDEELRSAVHRRLADGDGSLRESARRTRRAAPETSLEKLATQRGKLLQLFYGGLISAEGFHAEESRITEAIETARVHAANESETPTETDLDERFESLVATLRDLDAETYWSTSGDRERRLLVEEMVEGLCVFPDHLEVTLNGAPRLHVLYREIRMRESENVQVVGAKQQFCNQPLATQVSLIRVEPIDSSGSVQTG